MTGNTKKMYIYTILITLVNIFFFLFTKKSVHLHCQSELGRIARSSHFAGSETFEPFLCPEKYYIGDCHPSIHHKTRLRSFSLVLFDDTRRKAVAFFVPITNVKQTEPSNEDNSSNTDAGNHLPVAGK